MDSLLVFYVSVSGKVEEVTSLCKGRFVGLLGLERRRGRRKEESVSTPASILSPTARRSSLYASMSSLACFSLLALEASCEGDFPCSLVGQHLRYVFVDGGLIQPTHGFHSAKNLCYCLLVLPVMRPLKYLRVGRYDLYRCCWSCAGDASGERCCLPHVGHMKNQQGDSL